MIKSKSDYNEYIKEDMAALFGNEIPSFIFLMKDNVFIFQKLLRKLEYYVFCAKKNKMYLIPYYITKIRYRRLSFKLGFTIHEHNFEEGLSIAHYGLIIVHPRVRIGKNCRIHCGVNIGADARRGDSVPKIGDNVYIGPGAKLFGDIVIGDNTVIGANAVVNKSFPKGNVSIGGIPAKIISEKGSEGIVRRDKLRQ